MANNILKNTEKDTKTPILREVINDQPQKKPDESAGLNIEAKFRIFEPISGKTIVEGRG